MGSPSRGSTALKVAAGCGLVTLAALTMLGVRVATLTRGRRFCAEVLGVWLSRAILWVHGVKLVLHTHGARPEGPCVYTFNHTSTLDMFLVLALGLPRTRYFMKRGSWIFPPFGLAAWMVGTFFTPPQRESEARVRCFQAACATLEQTGDSVLLSPEGTRVTTGDVGRFNKGAFHLATRLRVPIVPLFIQIPLEANPGKGFGTSPCTVHVHVLPAVSTASWRLEELERNKEQVRERYINFAARSASPTLSTSSEVSR